jgi:hypothetical protein
LHLDKNSFVFFSLGLILSLDVVISCLRDTIARSIAEVTKSLAFYKPLLICLLAFEMLLCALVILATNAGFSFGGSLKTCSNRYSREELALCVVVSTVIGFS